jgi:hypothetical protein
MKNMLPSRCCRPRRDAIALLAGFGVTREMLAQDAAVTDPRSYRVLFENDRVRILEYKSRPGLGVCGQGMHTHPDHVTISLTGAKLKVSTPDGKAVFRDVPPGHAFFAPAETHAAEIIGGSGTRSILVELKDRGWKASTG